MHIADKVHQLISSLTSDECTSFDVCFCCCGATCLPGNGYFIMELISSGNFSCCEMSEKFCSAENFGPGPIFSKKIVPPGTNFPEKGPVLKILFQFILC